MTTIVDREQVIKTMGRERVKALSKNEGVFYMAVTHHGLPALRDLTDEELMGLPEFEACRIELFQKGAIEE